MTAVEGQAVIPLPLNHTSKDFALNVPGQKGIQKHFFKTKSHGIDMGFSITLHKIQGQTCRRLIVDLNHRPFPSHISYSGFYVAVSRVRNGDDLRIMPLQPNVSDLNDLASLQNNLFHGSTAMIKVESSKQPKYQLKQKNLILPKEKKGFTNSLFCSSKEKQN